MLANLVIPVLVVCAALLLAALATLRHRRRRRVRADDALKVLATAQLESRTVTPSTLRTALASNPQTTRDTIDRLADAGLVGAHDDRIELTPSGHARAMHLLRAHRLMERYLVDEAGMSILQIHRQADRAEHELTPEQVAALSAHLGHPVLDPHGDPIPDRQGIVAPSQRVGLDAWPIDQPARIVHVEDEPPASLRRIVAAGLLPGAILRITHRDDAVLTLQLADAERSLPAELAEMVHVAAAEAEAAPIDPLPTLASLSVGQACEVVGLADACRGLTRRRLLDLGMTPGARVRAELANMGRSAQAYRVRESLIALRREQAEMVLVRLHEELAA